MKRSSLTLLVVVLAAIVLTSIGTGLYVDLLWFIDLELEEVFWVRHLSEWGLRIGAFLFFFLFLWINLLFTRRHIVRIPSLNLKLREELFAKGYLRFLSYRWLAFFFLVISLLLSFILTPYAGNHWMEMQQYFNSTGFALGDPIFGQDASFYVFQLPFLRFVYGFLMMTLVVTLLALVVIYLVITPPEQVGRKWYIFPFPGLGHISLIAGLIFLLKAWDYRLQMWELLTDYGGYMFGAGYTDVNINMNVLWALLFLAVIIGIVFLANIYVQKTQLLVSGFVVIIAVSLVGGSIVPGLVQNFLVQPSQFSYEKPYIEHNIAFTRYAYGLDQFDTVAYPVEDTMTMEDVEANPGTFQNVRLWDYRPIETTYNERQTLWPYYRFRDVDIDRYDIDGDYRQVMLSARELDQDRFGEDARTWVNQHLQYTHGYGVAMSPVNEVDQDGLPTYFIQDLPPSTVEGIELEEPGIYYGELTREYVFTNTRMREFDHPDGDQTAYTTYEGEGGIPLENWFRRLLFALRFGDYRILFSGELEEESRLKFDRTVQERVNKVAPFLEFDPDPYVVVNDGRLFWIQDAYTVSDRFPYSEPYGGKNYIRNSVKIVVDAYHGDVDLYIADEEDPMIQTYDRIFPDLFQSLEDMPEGLRDHIRYPEQLFSTQAQVYQLYHITDPNVFYNREGIWEIPMEKYRGEEQRVEPYYVMLQLPGETEEEFVMIQPFTPARRNNMVSWMAARCDGEHYGEVKVYRFPRAEAIYGPQQIENRIDQSPEISELLALWDQRGSEVVRGNLLVLPIEDSILYVEPIFMRAEAGGLPELARVIVSFDGFVVMAPTLDEALEQLLDDREVEDEEEIIFEDPEEIDDLPEPEPDIDPEPEPEEPDIPEREPVEDPDARALIQEANAVFEEAQRNLRDGDWVGYGEKIDELEEILQELEEVMP